MKTRSKISPDEIERMVAATFGDDEDETGLDETAPVAEDDGDNDEDDSSLPVAEDDLEDDEDAPAPAPVAEDDEDEEEYDEDEVTQAMAWARDIALAGGDDLDPVADDDLDTDGDDDDVDSDDLEDAPVAPVEDETYAPTDDEGEDEEADAAFLATLAATSEDFVNALIATGAVIAVEPYMASEERVLASEFAEFEDEDAPVSEDDLEDEPTVPSEVDADDLEDDEDAPVAPVDTDLGVTDEDEDEDYVAPVSEDDEDETYAPAPVADDEDDSEEADSGYRHVAAEDEEEEDTVEFQPVASLEEIATATADEVDMHFYQDAGNQSHWVVTIAGAPAACISSETMNKEAIPFFMTEDFGRNAIKAMASEGVDKVLTGMKARFYATAYRHSELADEVKASVEADANTQLTAKLAEMHESFLDNATLAAAGIDKNIWPKIGNPLKEALFDAFVQAGVHESAIVPTIENAFALAGKQYFRAIAGKAVELMNMHQEARDVIKETVANSAIMSVDSEISDEDEAPVTAGVATFASRLESGDMSGFVGASAHQSAPGLGLGAKIAARFGR